MKDISGYMDNPFASAHYGLPSLMAFATDHYQRLKANNPGGIWDARIAATAAALADINSTETNHLMGLGLRKASKAGKAKFRRELRGKLGQIHATMWARYGLRSPEITAVFGKSRGRMARTVDDRLKEDLMVVAEGVVARAADLGATVVAQAQNLLADWTTVWQASEAAAGAKSAAQQAKRSARAALQRELFRNLLAIAAQFPGEREKLKLYMQKSLLRVGRKS